MEVQQRKPQDTNAKGTQPAANVNLYEHKLHVAPMCIAGASTVAVIMAEEVRLAKRLMCKAACKEPKPRLYLQWWSLYDPACNETSKEVPKSAAEELSSATDPCSKKVAELHILTSRGLNGEEDVHSDLVMGGRRTLACALAADSVLHDVDDVGGWLSVIHIWDSQSHTELTQLAPDCAVSNYERPPVAIRKLACFATDDGERVQLAIATRHGGGVRG